MIEKLIISVTEEDIESQQGKKPASPFHNPITRALNRALKGVDYFWANRYYCDQIHEHVVILKPGVMPDHGEYKVYNIPLNPRIILFLHDWHNELKVWPTVFTIYIER